MINLSGGIVYDRGWSSNTMFGRQIQKKTFSYFTSLTRGILTLTFKLLLYSLMSACTFGMLTLLSNWAATWGSGGGAKVRASPLRTLTMVSYAKGSYR